MKKKTTTRSKLNLSRTELRKLSGDVLAQVAGGTIIIHTTRQHCVGYETESDCRG